MAGVRALSFDLVARRVTVTRFASVYTPIVFVAAIIVATVPPIVGADTFHSWPYRALVLLVLACPCALVISTPVTLSQFGLRGTYAVRQVTPGIWRVRNRYRGPTPSGVCRAAHARIIRCWTTARCRPRR